jgi:ribonuclease Z
MMPMSYRMLSSLALRLNGRIYLFDAGEGAQINWKRARLGVRGLKLIAITHLHADHCLGVPGMIMLRAQMDDPDPLTILGPPGTRDFIVNFRKLLEFKVNFQINIIEWSADSAAEPAYVDDQARIFWQPLKHTRFCLGYRFEEHDRPGKFDPVKANRLEVPMGPLWSKLQRGENVQTPSGNTVEPSEVLGPARKGRHIAYVVDTRPARGVYSLCRNADLAFLEGMFISEHAEHADVKGHMTVTESARIAKKAGVAKAVLVHISPRYENNELGKLEQEAQKEFSSVKIGRDLDTFEVSFPEKADMEDKRNREEKIDGRIN